MIPVRKESDEVLYPSSAKIDFAVADVERLKRMADNNPRGRVRLCVHDSPKSIVHEMIIVHRNDCYVRPHCHMNRDESVHIIEGSADLIVFDSVGEVRSVVELGDMSSGGTFFCKIVAKTIHMLLFKSPHLVFKEVTQGPFDPDAVFFPDWAPAEGDPQLPQFLDGLRTLLSRRKEG